MNPDHDPTRRPRKYFEEPETYPVTKEDEVHASKMGRLIGFCALLIASVGGSYGIYRVGLWVINVLGLNR